MSTAGPTIIKALHDEALLGGPPAFHDLST